MFYLTYLHRELRRRLGRTVLTVLGLAVGVSLVVVVSSLSAGLDRAQSKILDPLEKVGTDLVVSRPVDVPVSGGQQGGGAGALLGGIPAEEVDALLEENQSLFQTDFSQLGKPGESFERELFLPATQLTFPKDEQRRVERIDGVDAVAGGLSLLAVHQKGKVPEIVATFETGGDTVTRDIDISPPSQAEWQSISACVQRTGGGPSCLPGRFRRLSAAFTTPREVVKQILDPPQTDLATEPYTAAGVDLNPPGAKDDAGKPDIGLITPAQISGGKFFSGADDEVVIADAYLERKNLEVGGTLVLNGKEYRIVGSARPPLGGQSADLYLPLSELQTLSGRDARVNMLFVRADSAADVTRVSKEIERVFPGAQVTSAKDLANQISGSLVDAGNLADRLGVALAAIALISAVLIAVLLTLSSVAKRIRELGTLGALGWSKPLIIRQVVAESFAQGGLGGIVGAGLGVAVALAITAAAPELHASAAQQSGPLSSSFGLGRVLADEAQQTITLSAPVRPGMVLTAVVLAIAGGLLAGMAGAMRAARLRPADALRELG